MEISVVIVSWNAKQYLDDCIGSILTEATGLRQEIIIVDNGSSDGSQEMVKSKYSNIHLICNNINLGFARANNIGIKESKGNYIFFINSDVKVLPGSLNYIFEYMNNHKEIGLLGPKVIGLKGETQRSCMEYPTIWRVLCRALAADKIFPNMKIFRSYLMTWWNHDDLREVDVVNGCFWAVRKEAIINVGFLDERFFMYGEDIDWCLRFKKAGWKVVFCPFCNIIHAGGGSSENAPTRFYVEKEKANMQLWRKYHNRYSTYLYKIILTGHHTLRLVGNLTQSFFKKYDMLSYKIDRSKATINMLWQKNS
jgi:hypothetical protein